MRQSMMRQLGGTIAATLALGCAVPATGSEAEPAADEYPDYVFACPDGGYQSGCDREDVERAVSLDGADMQAFADRCLYATEAGCSVIASGRINRATGDPALYWQLLALQPSDGPYAEMIVLAELDGPVPALLFSHQVDGYFDPPVTAREGDGRFLLHIPARNRGLGNADLVLFTSGAGWNWTSADDIRSEVDALLPEGFIVSNPISFNFREGTAFALVRRDTDAGCCATGGVVIFDFEQGDHTLAVSSVSFTETSPVGSTRRMAPPTGTLPAGDQ